MDRETYLKHDPEGGHHFDLDTDSGLMSHIIDCGMLEFTPETAHNWAGPYPGNCSDWWLEDYRLHRWYKQPFGTRQANYERQQEQWEKYAAKAKTKRDRKRWEKLLKNLTVDNTEDNYSHPTDETPIALRLHGNDDTSYTKFYPTVEAARKDLDLFLACEPLDFQDVKDAGFGFTN